MLFHLQICGELQEGVSPEKQTLFEGRMREQRAERQLACCLFIWGQDAGTESKTATWLLFITSSQTPVPSKGFWPLSKRPPRRKIEFYKRENIICFSQAEKITA